MIIDKTFPQNEIKIGNNAQENDNLVKNAKQTDIWFHLANFPSCHEVVSIDKKNKLNKKIIKYCAKLCKDNTKYNNYRNIRVNYTEMKNVKRTEKQGKVALKGNINSINV